MKNIERAFEQLLWNSRLLVVLAVIASLLAGFGMFVVASVDAAGLLANVARYLNPALTEIERAALRSESLAVIVDVVDGYLLAAVMLIFALGLYELFVNKIDVAEGSEFAQRVLLIRSLDDLKDRLAKVILLMLVVKFFQQALQTKYNGPLELLYLALGIVLVSAALWISHGKEH